MNENNYQITQEVKTNAQKAFVALTTKIDQWWGPQDNHVTKLGDTFKISWGAPWYQFEVVVFEPNHAITWKCIDANQLIDGLEGVEKEWVGTQLHWTLSEGTGSTIALQLIHEGLVPDFICYDFCSKTWDSFIKTNLKIYLEG